MKSRLLVLSLLAVGFLHSMNTNELKFLSNMHLPMSSLGELEQLTQKGLNFKQLSGVLEKLPKTELNLKADVSVPQQLIANIKGISLNVPMSTISANLSSISDLTQKGISANLTTQLMKKEYNLQHIAGALESTAMAKAKGLVNQILKMGPKEFNEAQQYITLFKSIANEPTLELMLQEIYTHRKEIEQAMNDKFVKSLPGPMRKPFTKAESLLLTNLSKLIKIAILDYKTLDDLLLAQFNGYPATKVKSALVKVISLMRKIEGEVPKPISSRIKKGLNYLESIAKFEFEKSDNTSVTIGNDLSSEEHNFVVNRSGVVAQSLRKHGINVSRDDSPRIALCASGGGYRAMTGARGFFEGLEESSHGNLMDTVTYISCLSGGTWATYPWLMRKHLKPPFTATDAANNLSQTMFNTKKDPFLMEETLHNKMQTMQMVKNLFIKFLRQEIISFVDIYGALIGNSLLRHLFDEAGIPNYYELKVHDLQGAMRELNPKSPMPIGTAVATNYDLYQWLEVTPFTSGGTSIGPKGTGAYVPTELFGSRFVQGALEGAATPPQFFGFFLGMFGSAFALNSTQFIAESGLKSKLENIPVLSELLHETGALKQRVQAQSLQAQKAIAKKRPLAAFLNNFTVGISDSLFGEQGQLQLVDAGLAFNLPLPPLVDREERKVDIIVIIDMSGGLQKAYKKGYASELYKAVEYYEAKAQATGKPNPFPLSLEELIRLGKTVIEKPYSVFKNDRMTVIYVPWPAQKMDCLSTWCNTFNFDYSKDNVNDLTGAMKDRAEEVAPVIIREAKEIVARGSRKVTTH